jgi:Holliday junction resolvase RusA-like endonuclease
MLTITIPGLPPVALRGNNWTATSGQRWARRRAAVDWGTAAHYAIIDARNRSGCPKSWQKLERVRIVVTFVFKDNRRIDMDNLEGQAMKPVWDAMTRCGLITDDRHQVIYERMYKAEVDPKRGPITIVEVSVP